MKKFLSVILCIGMLVSFVPSAFAETVTTVAITIFNVSVAEPKAGEKPGEASVPETASSIVKKTEWKGELDANGCFIDGNEYTIYVTVGVKEENIGRRYIRKSEKSVKVNGNIATIGDITEDKLHAVITYTFVVGATKTETDSGTNADSGKKEESTTPASENVSDFAPGDSGTVTLTGSAPYYNRPVVDGKYHEGGISANDGTTLNIVEAYVPSINRENEFFHVIKFNLTNDIGYVQANPPKATYSNYVRTGNNPQRPYAAKWASQIKIGDPIKEMETWLISVKDGNPHYNFIGSYEEKEGKYYLADIKYDAPNGVKPFVFISAVATFKASDGYYFDKSFKINEYQATAEHTTGYKRIDDKTVEVYLTGFTGAMGYDIRITDAMQAYKKKIAEMNPFPVATAQINAPLFDHWQQKLQRRDFDERGDYYVRSFIEKNMRSYYEYPTTEQRSHVNGTSVSDGGKTNRPAEYKILSIDILDDDLSDDIPGLVGEWCLISGKKFIPKACLKDIKYETMFTGAPAEFVNSPFSFAGGSGTINDPYLIETADQLNAVRKGPKYHYKLIADIDLSSWGNWVPIGGTPGFGHMGSGDPNKVHQYSWAFQGSFDGNGHVVSGMKIIVNEETPFLTEAGNWRAFGLFANLATNPDEYKIKNLGVVNFTIDVNYTNMKKDIEIYAGAIGGGMNNGTDIYNCYSKGGKININVTFNAEHVAANPNFKPRAVVYAGGICSKGGGVFSGGTRRTKMHIEKCFNASDINVNVLNGDKNIYAGGIIASMDTTHIHECFNSGNITIPVGEGDYEGSWHDSFAGGICAYASIPEIPGIYNFPPEGASFIQNCYNTGTVTARSAAGIFNFSASDIHLENCYNTGLMIGNVMDNQGGMTTMSAIISAASAVSRYGTQYIRNCYSDGNSVSGSAWRTSSLGRKVLASVPEDNQPTPAYNFKPSFVGGFYDVPLDAWFASPVRWAVSAKVTSGTSATTFSPDNTCTRAQILTFMWRAVGSPNPTIANPFGDVNESDYFYKAALWAYSKGMVSGTAFEPNTPCTRSATVVYLWKNASSPAAVYNGNFSDVSANADYAKAVAWAVAGGITSGTSATTFSPDSTCTRGQIVTFLSRALR